MALTLLAAGYAAFEGRRLADLTHDMEQDAQSAANSTHGDNVNALEAARVANNSTSTASNAALTQSKTQFVADERPYLWFGTLNKDLKWNADSGTITWQYQYTDYGRTPAYNIRKEEHFWIGRRECSLPEDATERAETVGSYNHPIPPQKVDMGDIVSCGGITQQQFAMLANTSGALTVTGKIFYTDSYGNRYETDFCMRNLANGNAWYCAGNRMK